MSDKDPNNREWTKADFARARSPASMTAAELKAFPKTRGPQKSPTKIPVSIRLDPDILAALKAGGEGWQSRVNGILRQAVLGAHDLSAPNGGVTVKVRKRTGEFVKVGSRPKAARKA